MDEGDGWARRGQAGAALSASSSLLSRQHSYGPGGRCLPMHHWLGLLASILLELSAYRFIPDAFAQNMDNSSSIVMSIETLCLITAILGPTVHALIYERSRKHELDSAERYDADGDLSVPIDAQGLSFQFNSTNVESEADRRRKNAPAKYENNRSLCYCNYSPEFCGGYTNSTCMKHLEASCFHFTEEIYNEKMLQMETVHLFGCAPLTRGSNGSYFTVTSCLYLRLSLFLLKKQNSEQNSILRGSTPNLLAYSFWVKNRT
ncbi:unnamed protein product [Gongylonema pulchrum]|uniref:Uncharacterized protein n=1 Tax=Gongylonema pulchrum TaxID=637853 RepID=A0A183EBK8_9BILA|nr:unnamed protein product [Gongylonema pulchrum]